MIGGLLLPAGCDLPGIAQEAVLQLLGIRILQPAEHAALRRDLDAVFLAQIFRRQRLEEDEAARAVGHGVEKLHGQPVLIHQHAERASAHVVERHVDERVALVLLNGGRLADLLEIIPEHAPAQPHRDRREAPHRNVQRRAQHLHVDRLCQRGGEAEVVRPVAPLGRGVDLRGVVQPHPPQLPGRGEHTRHKLVDRVEIRHILIEIIQHIRVPALRRDDEPAPAARGQQLFVQHPRVVEHDLVPAHEQQRRRQPRQIAEQRRAQRVLRMVGIARRVKLQQLRRHGGVNVAVVDIRLAGAGQIGPRRDADQPAWQRQLPLLEPQAQAVDQPAARRLAAQQDLVGRIPLREQILIADERIIQRGRETVLRREPVGGAEHAHAAFVRERRGKALGIVEIAAGVAAAMQIQNHALPPLVLRHDPRALEGAEIMIPDDHVPPVDGLHQLAQLVLPPARRLQRAVCDKRLKEIQL